MKEFLNAEWQNLLKDELESEYFNKLENFLQDEYKNNTIFPPKEEVFSALNFTRYEDIKVVIIGQDPYHGDGQANGMCFSVSDDVACPPSLVNIFKALYNDLGIRKDSGGNLCSWAKQGVLLLNNSLTVRKGQPQSHGGKGWEIFTDAVIKLVNKKTEPVVFMLWGSFAQSKEALITNKQHLILKSVHPSPLSCYRGFLECKHFSKANDFLLAHDIMPIEW